MATRYFNPDNILFREAATYEVFVDKSLLIAETSRLICTPRKYICVTRPRRFGKTVAANMLAAYYSRGCSSRELFSSLKISLNPTFENHLNRYNVIRLTMTKYSKYNIEDLNQAILEDILPEAEKQNIECKLYSVKALSRICEIIFDQTKIPFIIIIDEWDSIIRNSSKDKKTQKEYLDFLRDFLKDQDYVALAYMTGILPIKKYGEHSALNMFTEYSMQNQRNLSEFTGFTQEETEQLCSNFNINYQEIKRWYDGYIVNGLPCYNPYSVFCAIVYHKICSYWTSTETYEALEKYIILNIDGLREKVERLIAKEEISIDTSKFKNDMVTFKSADDVLTLLVHLGYLTYDSEKKVCKIPNEEVSEEFTRCISDGGWESIMQAIKQSEDCLNAIWSGGEADAALTDALKAADAAIEAGDTLRAESAFAAAKKANDALSDATSTVARIVEQVHQDNVSIIRYNDENSLALVVVLALYTASKDYMIVREMPTGKGYADIAFIPRANRNRPAIIMELKKDMDPSIAIKQIKNRNYPDQLLDFAGEVILVGMSYSSNSGKVKYKKHQCIIQKLLKELD